MMILLLHRRYIWGAAVLALVTVTFFSLLAQPPAAITAFSRTASDQKEVIVLDAGHGGSDGGAVSADGIPEDDINLAIVLRLRDFFSLMGRQTVLTRTGEASLADKESTSLRNEKVSDTRNRVELINSVAGGHLISIHQNALPGHPSVHGAQVFYGKVPESDTCASVVQQALNESVNVGNEKNAKPIGSDIYIMAHAQCPAILVECGFLSNSAETRLLCTPEYQTKIAAAIGCGYLQYQ